MKILQIIAHPDTSEKSFTGQLAQQYRKGANEAEHQVTWLNLYDEDIEDVDLRQLVLETDAMCLVYPLWWEMPPAKMVEFLQTTFVFGFAFELKGDRMVPKIDIPTTVLISMGQQKTHNTSYLEDAMKYCGLHPKIAVFQNVGPRLTPDQAEAYLDLAHRLGKHQ